MSWIASHSGVCIHISWSVEQLLQRRSKLGERNSTRKNPVSPKIKGSIPEVTAPTSPGSHLPCSPRSNVVNYEINKSVLLNGVLWSIIDLIPTAPETLNTEVYQSWRGKCSSFFPDNAEDHFFNVNSLCQGFAQVLINFNTWLLIYFLFFLSKINNTFQL